MNFNFHKLDSVLGLTHYWLFNNGLIRMKDTSLTHGAAAKLSPNRFGEPRSALEFNRGYSVVRPGAYFQREFTITLWFKLSENQQYIHVFDFGNGASKNNFILLIANNYQILFERYHGNRVERLHGPIIELNKWSFIAIIKKSLQLKLIMNNQILSSVYSNYTGNAMTQFNYFGRSNWKNDPLTKGCISDVRIFNRGLSLNEAIYQQYTMEEMSP